MTIVVLVIEVEIKNYLVKYQNGDRSVHMPKLVSDEFKVEILFLLTHLAMFTQFNLLKILLFRLWLKLLGVLLFDHFLL